MIVSISQIFGGAGLAAGVTVGALLAQQMLGRLLKSLISVSISSIN